MNKKILAAAGLSLALFSLIAFGAQAQNIDDTLNGLNNSANQVNAFKDQTKQSFGSDFLSTKAGQVIGLVLSFVGVLFLGLMIYAGIRWMTAQGNDQTVAEAKNLIINAVIGIIIVFAAYAITVFLSGEILQ